MLRLPFADFYQGRTLNLAHRGAREHAPENTLPAFEQAFRLGADGVELDVQISGDGVPIVIHDPTVDRTTNGTGPVLGKTLAELRELDAGFHHSPEYLGTPIPTLDEVLEAVGQRLLLNVELKPFGPRRPLAEEVTWTILAHGLSERVLVSSFDPLILRQVKQLVPELQIGFLSTAHPFRAPKEWLARSLIGTYTAHHPHFSMIDSKYVSWARREGYRINVWGVKALGDICHIHDWGLDAIINDCPTLVRDVLQGGLQDSHER